MKKMLASLLCLIIILSGVVYAKDSESSINFSFDSGSSYLNIVGKFSDKPYEPITMIVTGSSDKSFSSDKTPEIMFLYVSDSNGTIKISEKISSSLPGGRYDVILTGQNSKYENYFIFMNPSDADTLALIDTINNAASGDEVKTIVKSDDNAAKLGIDLADLYVGSYCDKALDEIVDCKDFVENNEYTPSSFLDMFSKLIAIEMINDGHVYDAMSGYASCFGTTLEIYESENAETDSNFEKLLKNAKFSVDNLENTYNELLLTAKIKSAKNWSYLQDIVLENSDAMDIETEDYNSIKKSSRYKVFEQMFDKIHSFESISDIKLSFENAVKSVLKQQKASKKDTTSGGGGSGGFSSITVPAQVAPIVVAPTVTETTPKAEFNDIENHFAKDYIISLASDGVISGYGDGNFLPEGYITRAEFVKIISLRFDIEKAGDKQYDDVSESDWFAPYVRSLSSSGIIMGYNGKFNPNDYITRQDAMVICMRVSEYLSKKFDGTRTFADSGKISDYAKESVETLGANGIIHGDGEAFRPLDNITRGETAAIICRLYNAIYQQ